MYIYIYIYTYLFISLCIYTYQGCVQRAPRRATSVKKCNFCACGGTCVRARFREDIVNFSPNSAGAEVARGSRTLGAA